MIVSQHQAGAAMGRRVGNDRPEREGRAALFARVARDVQAARLIIDMRNPEAFEQRIGIGETTCEKPSRRYQPVEFQRVFGTL